MAPSALIIGAKSDMAVATAKKFAANGYSLYLAGRNAGEIESLANDIAIRYKTGASALELDILDFDSHQQFYDSLNPAPEVVICFVGYMPEQRLTETDFDVARRVIDTNFTGCVSILNRAALEMEKSGRGSIIGVSSVAGERGRATNYTYGSAKAGFTAYLSGLRNRMFKHGVHVMTVKPGFVYTKMTEDLDLPAKLTAKPEDVASDIYKAFKKKKNILYTKWMWKHIMRIIKNIPEGKFKKMKL